MKAKTLRLWAKRYCVSIGWHWSYCRDVTEADLPRWIAIWQTDEPETTFAAFATSKTSPRPIKPNP